MQTQSSAREKFQRASLGDVIVSFRRTQFYSVFACIVTIMMIFIIYTISQTFTALFISVALIFALWAYVYTQWNSRLVLHEGGIHITGWLMQETILWSDIAFRFAQCSVIANPNTLIRLVLTRKNGKEVIIPNNWKPGNEFTIFMWLLLDQDSSLLIPEARLKKSDIFIVAEEIPLKQNLKMLLPVLGVFFFPIVLGLTAVSDLSNNFKTVIFIGSIAVIMWLFSFYRKQLDSDV